MRYKELVVKEIAQAETLTVNVIKGMDNKTISVQEAYNKLKVIDEKIKRIKEIVNLEHDQ